MLDHKYIIYVYWSWLDCLIGLQVLYSPNIRVEEYTFRMLINWNWLYVATYCTNYF